MDHGSYGRRTGEAMTIGINRYRIRYRYRDRGRCPEHFDGDSDPDSDSDLIGGQMMSFRVFINILSLFYK